MDIYGRAVKSVDDPTGSNDNLPEDEISVEDLSLDPSSEFVASGNCITTDALNKTDDLPDSSSLRRSIRIMRWKTLWTRYSINPEISNQQMDPLLYACSYLTFTDSNCELEAIVQRLSEKHSKYESVSRALHLKKMMKTWTKAHALPDDVCLPVNLSDILNRGSKGRWWIVGVAGKNNAMSSTNPNNSVTGSSTDVSFKLSPEVEAAAARLGLRTETRKLLFHTLVSTPGGPDATATALVKACGGGTHAGSASREREMIQIVVHCLMAESPFNRFYPRVLGSLINLHRRFLPHFSANVILPLGNTFPPKPRELRTKQI
ncbi:unnamed protein product [Echinostoma caproni]|uniref:MyTH4 domain-containing protein n=1 Tax=Echinostoma caproni TaxID=27848 RepID=A0A183AV38_9TREM|nr:unnamed protein product [Echinostoma caproni]